MKNMNWISRSSLKDKHWNIISLMQKFVLVLALFVIMAATAHAGAFLYKNGETVRRDVQNNSNPFINDDWVAWDDGDDSQPGVYKNTSKYTGFYLGTFEGNVSNKTSFLRLINAFLDDYIFTVNDLDWVKFENISTGTNTKNQDSLAATVNASDKKSGTWSVEKSNQEEAINFYTVKGSNMFALYYIDPNHPTGTGIGQLPIYPLGIVINRTSLTSQP
jgi:hypothetical protein